MDYIHRCDFWSSKESFVQQNFILKFLHLQVQPLNFPNTRMWMLWNTRMTAQLFPLFGSLFLRTALLPLSAHHSTHRPRQQSLNHTAYSVLRFPSQQNSSLVSDPHNKSDHNYLSIIHHSNALSLLSILWPTHQIRPQLPLHYTSQQCSLAPSISVSDHPFLTCQSTLMALAKWPFSTTPTTLQPTNSRPEKPAQICIKEVTFPRRVLMMAKSTKRIALGADQPSALWLPWLGFSVIFPQL